MKNHFVEHFLQLVLVVTSLFKLLLLQHVELNLIVPVHLGECRKPEFSSSVDAKILLRVIRLLTGKGKVGGIPELCVGNCFVVLEEKMQSTREESRLPYFTALLIAAHVGRGVGVHRRQKGKTQFVCITLKDDLSVHS